MNYFIRPDFNSERADEIVGPLSLEHINWMLARGKATPAWMVISIAGESIDDIKLLSKESWQPLTELPDAACYKLSVRHPQVKAGNSELAGCLKHILMIMLGLLASAVMVLAIIYSTCGDIRNNYRQSG